METYCKAYAPDIDRQPPLDVQERFRGSIHDWHDVASMGARTEPSFTKVGKQQRSDLRIHQAGKVYGATFKLLARNGTRHFSFF